RRCETPALPKSIESFRLRKQHKTPIRQHDACGAVAQAARGTSFSLRLTFDIIKLPAQDVLVLPGNQRLAISRAQGEQTGAHSTRSRRLDFSRWQDGAVFIESGEIDLALRRPSGHVSRVRWANRVVSHRAGVDVPTHAADACARWLGASSLIP